MRLERARAPSAGLASIALVVLGGALLLPAPAPAESHLPPLECVRELRSARIASMLQQTEVELERLWGAREPCGDGLVWVQAMLAYHRRSGLDAERHDELHARLLEALEGDDRSVPEAVIRQLVWEPDLDAEVRSALAAALNRRVAAQQDASLRSLRSLGQLLLRLERYEEAAEVLEQVSARDAGETTDWKLAGVYRRLERWSDEARVLRRIVDRGRLQAGLFRPRLIDVLVRAGEHEAAYREITVLLGTGNAAVAGGLLVEMAWHFRDAGLDGRAEELFRRALEVPARTAPSLGELPEDPTVAPREAALAVAHLYSEGEEREELLTLATGGDRVSDDPFVLYERGTQALTSGELEQAFDLLAAAAPDLPELEAAWYNLALVAYRLKRWEAAAGAYAHANALNPDRADGWFFQGLALVNLERCAEAIEPLLSALRLDPERVLAHYHLAECYVRLGRDREAAPHLEAWQESRAPGP